MRILKKSLAICLAAILAMTAMFGCIVSADTVDITGTITVGNETITVGTESVTLPITVTVTEAPIFIFRLAIKSDFAILAAENIVATDAEGNEVVMKAIEDTDANLDKGIFIFEAKDWENESFKTATVDITFNTSAAEVSEDPYVVEAYGITEIEGADINENGATFTYVPGSITVVDAGCTHVAGDAVVENNVDATCTSSGSYDNVIYCSECGEEMTRETITVDALGHTPAEAVVENNVDPTCTEPGSYDSVIYCSVCGDEIGRTGCTVPATDHTAAEAVVENNVDATCAEPGYYDSVVYCSVCGEMLASTRIDVEATGAHKYVDGACSVCGSPDPDASVCEHANATSEVTKQPTKDAVGVMTYTCECGETWTEDIAIPYNYESTVNFLHELSITSVVADAITVSTKHIREKIGEDYTYFINIDYQKYGVGHILEDKNAVLTSALKEDATSTTNKDVYKFTDIALYEMTLDLDATLYLVDGNGVVTGYETRTICIADIAYDYCVTYGETMPTLVTAMADMCRYGDEIQKFFAKASPDGDIVDAVLPSAILGETYMASASPIEDAPVAGSYNNECQDKILADGVTSTDFVSTSKTLSIGATNQIYYRIRHDDYAFEDIKIEVSYYNPLYKTTYTYDVTNDIIDDGTTSAGYTKYKYYFSDLAIYACDETVTMNMYYKDNLELTSTYSLGNFANTYMSDANYTDFIVALELFSNSMGIQLGCDARW